MCLSPSVPSSNSLQDPHGHRTTGDQHHPHALHGRRQAANSGHPGTPMALAPVAYVLCNEFLRYDPADPALARPRPLRALLRPCLDAALLDAAPDRREAAGADGQPDRRAGRAAGRHPPLPPARQPLPGPSRVWPHQRRRDDHRPAGPGRRQQRGHGDRRPLAGRATTTGPASSCSTSTSTPCAATAT